MAATKITFFSGDGQVYIGGIDPNEIRIFLELCKTCITNDPSPSQKTLDDSEYA
jgi:hypothetical protein